MITMNDCEQAGYYEYKGLSTDTKPTNCYVNSLFLELDTGYFYYFDGSTWVKTKSGDGYTTFKSLIDRSITKVTEEMTEDIGYIKVCAFKGCSALKTVVIGKGATRIYNNAFENCGALESVNLSNGIGYICEFAFSGCTELANIDFGEELLTIDKMAFYNCSRLGVIELPSGTKTIGDCAFENCSGATKLSLPSTLESIGAFAFKGCSSISSITIPSSITSIQKSTFENCSGATSLSLTKGTTKIGKCAFKGCSSLTSLNIPFTLTHLDNEAFAYCSSLKSILYSGWPVDGETSLKQIGYACFSYCTSLKYVWIPATTVRPYGDWTGSSFAGCTALKTVEIQDGIDRIGDNTFDGCTSLENINFPGSLGNEGNIGIQAFRDCRSLSNITVGDGVTLICDEAFIGCDKLMDVTLPSSISHISTEAFYYSGMYSLTIYAEWPPILDANGIYRWRISSSLPYLPAIKVPLGSVETYKNASGWSSFRDQISAM